VPLTYTTVQALREAIRDKIDAITPDHDRYEHTWRRVANMAEVVGTNRGYYVSITNQRRRTEGGMKTSSWATYDADLKVWTGYGSLTDERWEDMAAADSRQIEIALARSNGQITGLIFAGHETWEDGESSATGKRWGAHTFRITYLLSQP